MERQRENSLEYNTALGKKNDALIGKTNDLKTSIKHKLIQVYQLTKWPFFEG